jgi:NADH-quinone oxidoreductase subunit N
LLLRVVFSVFPEIMEAWSRLLVVLAGLTILYGNLCAIPQRNLKRLMGYSSIAHAGYLLLGVSALSAEGQSAVLFYVAGYLFAVLAVFGVLSAALRGLDTEDLSALAGLHRRSPFLAATLAIAMVSLAGIPPLVGFFGKFLLIKAVLAQGSVDPAYYWLTGVALFGVVVSFYYYLGVVRAIYWGEPLTVTPPATVVVAQPLHVALVICVVATLVLGLAPGWLWEVSRYSLAFQTP